MNSFKSSRPAGFKSIICFVFLLVLLGVSRYLPLDYPQLFNFTPVLAIFLISGSYIKGYLGWFTPVLSVMITDFALSQNYGQNLFEPFMLATFLSYLLIFMLGRFMGSHRNLLTVATQGILAALGFHLITCLFAWWANPAYAKTITGVIHATIWGEPGYAPAYMFLRNSLLSTVLFATALSIAANYFLNLKTTSTSQSIKPSTASSTDSLKIT